MSEALDQKSTAAHRLRRAVNAAATGEGSRIEVEGAARALVAELRGCDQPPEQVLVQMKTLLADAGLRAAYPGADGGTSDGNHAALYRDIITWSIRCYYEDVKSGKSPSSS